MGCGQSKLQSEAESLPARIRPLLRRRFEEIKKRRRATSLKKSRTGLSKKELLKDGVSDDDAVSSMPHDSDDKSISSLEDSLKVVPVQESNGATISKPVEHDHKAPEAPVPTAIKVVPTPTDQPEKPKEERVVKWNTKNDDHNGGEETKSKASIITAVRAIKTAVHLRDKRGDRKGDKKGEETEDEDEEKVAKWNVKNDDHNEGEETKPKASIVTAVRAIKTAVHLRPRKGDKKGEETEEKDEEKVVKRNTKNDDHNEGEETTPKASIVTTVRAIKTTVHLRDRKGDRKGEETEEEDEDDLGRLSSITADSLCPGSPSFRVYFIESLSSIKDDDDDDDEEDDDVPEVVDRPVDKDYDSDKKSQGDETTESRNSSAGSETKTTKKTKRRIKLRRVIPKGSTGAVKHLLNVKSCYNPSCAGYDRARLLANKADA